jgi:hypothetical protein
VGAKRLLVRIGLTTLPRSCADCLAILGTSTYLEPKGPVQFCIGIPLPFILKVWHAEYCKFNRKITFLQLQQVIGRLATAQSDLQDERQINRALQQNQTAWQSKFQALEKEFNEYKIDKDKVNVMFFYSIYLRF